MRDGAWTESGRVLLISARAIALLTASRISHRFVAPFSHSVDPWVGATIVALQDWCSTYAVVYALRNIAPQRANEIEAAYRLGGAVAVHDLLRDEVLRALVY